MTVSGTFEGLLPADEAFLVEGKPFFLNGSAGRLFSIYFSPPRDVPHVGDVLLVPPFGEEMNKARRMLSLQARQFAHLGLGTLLVDLYGTGESEGEFLEARWQTWLEDLKAAATWLHQSGAGIVSVLGLRVGALLALDWARTEERLEKVILWQPVLSGQSFMNQFLRLRLAASIRAGTKVTTGQLKERLAAGEPVEVAGYELHPELFAAIDGLKLEELAGAEIPPVDWLEVTSDRGKGLSPASLRVVEAWRGRGIRVTASAVVGEPFWTTQETTVAPALLEATLGLYKEGDNGGQ